MLFDNRLRAEQTSDQAEGLRQRRRCDVASQTSVGDEGRPRVVLVSEFPATDAGVRFAFHLTHALGMCSGDRPLRRSLLLDLAPAASRLPQVLSDAIAVDRYRSLWGQLAAGASLPAIDLLGQSRVSVAAEPQQAPPAVDQLPRLYDELSRQLGQQPGWNWIVLLAGDHIVPLDQACWQAAQDIVLVGDSAASGCRRHCAVLRSRLPQLDVNRRLWSMPQRRASWPIGWRFGWQPRLDGAASAAHWLAEGIAARPLPAADWPRAGRSARLERGSRADRQLQRSALAVAGALQSASGVAGRDAGRDCGDLARLAGSQKKIQLRAELRPITQLSEVFRA